MTSQSNKPLGYWQKMVVDWSADKETFQVSWGKLMMWIFLVGDTFIFSIFLIAYMKVRMSATAEWPSTSDVFALEMFGVYVPLLLIAIMTFILITSSGTMAMAVNYAYQGKKKVTFWLMMTTAFLGLVFVGFQVFEWTKLIVDYGIRPWGNPFGAEQFGAIFFMITGFHGLHVTGGVIYIFVVALKVRRGDYDKRGFQIVEITGLYWHFVDLVWVFIFAFFYLW